MLTEKCGFDEIYKQYKNLVLAVAFKYSKDRDLAEDITQNTFMKLYVYYDSLNHSNIKSWLYTTAKHCALNYKAKVRKEIPSEQIEDELEFVQDISAEDEVMEELQRLEHSELHERISAALLEKNPRWHEVVMLVYYLDIPQTEVARNMGLRVGTIHSILHRAKSWIQETYHAEYEELDEP
ncbi:MAG: RNA polymerase sigma factor [Muricomes sp.]